MDFIWILANSIKIRVSSCCTVRTRRLPRFWGIREHEKRRRVGQGPILHVHLCNAVDLTEHERNYNSFAVMRMHFGTMQPPQFLVVWVFVGAIQVETAIVILEEGELHTFANPALALSLGEVRSKEMLHQQ